VAIPSSAIGTELLPVSALVERGRLRFFAEAIGEFDPLYSDLAAARAAGYPDLPVPLTFLFGLELDGPDPFSWLTDFGVDLRFVLHGSQRFSYNQLAFAGDDLLLKPTISSVYEKRGGALEFVIVDTLVTRGAETIATSTKTVVVRHPELETAR
jgi:hypothetical protein